MAWGEACDIAASMRAPGSLCFFRRYVISFAVGAMTVTILLWSKPGRTLRRSVPHCILYLFLLCPLVFQTQSSGTSINSSSSARRAKRTRRCPPFTSGSCGCPAPRRAVSGASAMSVPSSRCNISGKE